PESPPEEVDAEVLTMRTTGFRKSLVATLVLTGVSLPLAAAVPVVRASAPVTPAYDYLVAAQTNTALPGTASGENVTGFGSAPAINDRDTVAFVATTDAGDDFIFAR